MELCGRLVWDCRQLDRPTDRQMADIPWLASYLVLTMVLAPLFMSHLTKGKAPTSQARWIIAMPSSPRSSHTKFTSPPLSIRIFTT